MRNIFAALALILLIFGSDFSKSDDPTVAEQVESAGKSALDQGKSAGDTVVDSVSSAGKSVADTADSAVKSVADTAQSAAKSVADKAQEAWGATQKFFTEKYNSAASLLATNRADVDSRMGDMQNYLTKLIGRKDELMAAAKNTSNAKAEEAINNMQTWSDEIKTLQTEGKTGMEDKDYVAKWEKWVSDKWSGGLEQVIMVSKTLSGGAAKNSLSLISLIIALSLLIQMT